MEEPTARTRGTRLPVLACRRFPGTALDALARDFDLTVHPGPGPIPRARLLAELAGKAGVLVGMTERVDGEFLDAAESLVVVANFGVGYDNIDVDVCTERGVMVTNTPGVLTETTADLTWAVLMAAARRVGEGERFIRSAQPWVWEPDFMLGRDVHGKVVGVVGFGRIGRAVARRARGFDMRVLYHGRVRAPEEAERAVSAEYREHLDDLLGEADFVSLHVSLNPGTRHLIDADRLRAMKPTAILVNASRGPVVDEAALVDALRERRIAAAALDVFEHEPEVHPGLRELENVVVVPHLGSATVEARTAMASLAAENLRTALEGGRPPNLVDGEAWERRRPLPRAIR
ncbi:MAG: 2-hydroxyacid dehydrogenase [Actinomycetota bacterium]